MLLAVLLGDACQHGYPNMDATLADFPGDPGPPKLQYRNH